MMPFYRELLDLTSIHG